MAADANIFAQYLKPVKSMQDYTNDMDTAEQNKLTLAAGRMKAQQDQQDMSDNNAFRALIAGGVDMNTPEGQARLYGAAPKRAGELLKSRSDLLKTKKEIEGLGTTQDAAKFKLAADRHAIYKKTIGALASDPALSKDMVLQAGQELVQAQIITPEMFQSATASLPDDPNALRSRLNQGVAGQMSAKEIMEVFAPKTEYKDNGKTLVPVEMNPRAPGYKPPVAIEKQNLPNPASDILIPDPQTPGKMIPNQPLISAKQSIAKAGAARTSVNTYGPKAFETELGKLDAEQLGKWRDLAQSGQSIKGTVQQLREAEKIGAYSGGGADTRLQVANLVEGWTGIAPKGVVGSQLYNAEASKLILDKVKALGANPSNADVQFMKQTVPQLATNAEARAQMADWMEKQADSAIARYQKADSYARQNSGLKGFKMFDETADAYGDAEKERRYQEWKAKQK